MYLITFHHFIFTVYIVTLWPKRLWPSHCGPTSSNTLATTSFVTRLRVRAAQRNQDASPAMMFMRTCVVEHSGAEDVSLQPSHQPETPSLHRWGARGACEAMEQLSYKHTLTSLQALCVTVCMSVKDSQDDEVYELHECTSRGQLHCQWTVWQNVP